MEMLKALVLSLGEIEEPVITQYKFGLTLYGLYKKRAYKGRDIIGFKKTHADREELRKYLNELLNDGVLDQYKNLPSTVYSLLGRSNYESEDVACSIDPFCYLSHLTAMSYHGLTDRIPSKLFISSPGPKDWKLFAEEKMRKDLGEDLEQYIENKMPKLQKTKFEKIGKTEVHRFNSVHLGAFKNVRDRSLRVATVGRTFLDMLRSPELSGGINHVLKVFDEYAHQYLRLIVNEIDLNGGDIDKVRAGYILDERLNIENDIVNSWIKYAQRGSSRKLDASSEYISEWSDKWCLSLNIFEKRK